MNNNLGLFTPVRLGALNLSNRVVMSPMTRIRADQDCIPSEIMVQYYSQRATAGLIITEGTHPSAMGRGYTYPPGLHTEAQALGWRRVTDSVHAAGGQIFVQLMHAGRVSHSNLLPDHALPVAPSAIAVSGEIHTLDGKKTFEVPRALLTEEVTAVVEEYRQAAILSKIAGFDGIELHAATGYLPNQFQVTGSNTRADKYGGTLANRSRFTLEVLEALSSVVGADRVGIKIAPGYSVNDIYDEDPAYTYTYLAQALNAMNLAYLHVGYDSNYARGTRPDFNPIDLLRQVYTGTLIAVGGFAKTSGDQAIAAGRADLIAFGRPYIANSDLVAKMKIDAPLATGDVGTYYGGSEHGYTDYPTMDNAAIALS